MNAKRSTYPDELTAKMHSEFQVSEETDQKHITWSALDAIADGDMTRSEAMEEYGVSEADLVRYRSEWKELSF
ncbi:MAG TPA: hypothetical protein VGE44_14620 [Daejeonella sp.]|uniref:hypothetical protein n=1 Tax=Daejeonella sp. TaxID=2805397 RepID=UPI002EDA3C27